MPSAKTPSIFATLLYSGKGQGNVVVTNLGPNAVSVRTGSNSSGNIYTSLGVGKTLTGTTAYLCNVKDSNGHDISITPPPSYHQLEVVCTAPSDTQSITDKEEVRIDGYLRKRKQAILSGRNTGVSGRELDANNHVPPSIRQSPDTCVHNAICYGGSETLHTGGGQVENDGRRDEHLIHLIKLLLDGRRVSVGTRRVA